MVGTNRNNAARYLFEEFFITFWYRNKDIFVLMPLQAQAQRHSGKDQQNGFLHPVHEYDDRSG
jgi:hypothetical protein